MEVENDHPGKELNGDEPWNRGNRSSRSTRARGGVDWGHYTSPVAVSSGITGGSSRPRVFKGERGKDKRYGKTVGKGSRKLMTH